jgi:hypothetical protein
VLALRDHDLARSAIAVLLEGHATQAAPFVLSVVLQPPASKPLWLDLDGAFLELGTVTQELCDQLAPGLADPATGSARRQLSFRLLVDFASDDRVFEAALRYFFEGHPHTEQIVRKRKKDPRVREILSEQLADEEKRSLHQGGRVLAYSAKLGVLAKYLAKLGDGHAKEVAERYKKFVRMQERRGDRYE